MVLVSVGGWWFETLGEIELGIGGTKCVVVGER